MCCQLGDTMVAVSSNLMLTDERVLWMAQKEARACSRIVESLQRIAVLRLASGSYYTVNIVHDLLYSLTLCVSIRSVHCHFHEHGWQIVLFHFVCMCFDCYFPPQNSHNIAVEAHVIKASSFNGMTCTLFRKVAPERTMIPQMGNVNPDINLDRQLSFKCNVTSNLSALALKVCYFSFLLVIHMAFSTALAKNTVCLYYLSFDLFLHFF